MKKTISILLVVSFAVVATACSGATSQASQSTSDIPTPSSQAVASEGLSEVSGESPEEFFEQAQGGMILLNSVYNEMFGAESDYSEETLLYGAYENEQAFLNLEDPAILYSDVEDVPEGYYVSPDSTRFYPVLNFNHIDELTANLSEYFTDAYMQTLQPGIEENFFEYNNTLYLVRYGRGYGSTSLDLDTVVLYEGEENALQAELLTFGEYDGEVIAEFIIEDGRWKIDATSETPN